MMLFRCFPWDREAADTARGGARWYPRLLQGAGRHDNPLLYGCLYASLDPLSPIVERLARFRGQELTADKLISFGLPVALGTLALPEEAELLDLDDPTVLVREDLRPSEIATNDRATNQVQAADLFQRHRDALGLRWWSTFESFWPNLTLFDRAEAALSVEDVHTLDVGDDVVREAAGFLGLPIAT
jgi:hypothetical protein